jgi:hypothetical protein
MWGCIALNVAKLPTAHWQVEHRLHIGMKIHGEQKGIVTEGGGEAVLSQKNNTTVNKAILVTTGSFPPYFTASSTTYTP